ncbi:hypothetical protein RND81_04G062600 [Saponaria officinalis]|uniref:Uncharacterized protein n=1 Tax=Saponaria officinalis TaxID=3572 RepID=A0AAW1LIH6_SAPOF
MLMRMAVSGDVGYVEGVDMTSNVIPSTPLARPMPVEKYTPPRQSKNKGSGKRMLTSKNKTIEKTKKPKRRCGNCKRMAYHDKRNCQEPFARHPPEEEESSDSERVDQQSFTS